MRFAKMVLMFAAALSSSTVGGFAVRSSSRFVSSSITFVMNPPVESPTALKMGLRSFFSRSKSTSSSTASSSITKEEVRSLFSLWNSALATGDSRLVAKRYAKTPILLPTVSDTPRTDFDSIVDYFDAFLKREPQGVIHDGEIRIGDGWAQDAGVYEFTMGTTGDKVLGRYTFIYVHEDGQWKIAHHHSSVMPEGIDVAQKITESEVKNLFHLWNDALATGDSTLVANRYAKEGVLLPTVSDKMRTDFAGIKNYFDVFLEMKPHGVILETNVMIGTNWAQDCGIYEFTLGSTGNKVKARYSFIYKYEDGQWKIAHHHSSQMPEEIEPKKKVEAPKVTVEAPRETVEV